VVGVVVADDDLADRLRGRRGDQSGEALAERWRAERIEDDDALRGDDETGIRVEAFVRVRDQAGLALHDPGVRRDLLGLHRDRAGLELLDRQREPGHEQTRNAD